VKFLDKFCFILLNKRCRIGEDTVKEVNGNLRIYIGLFIAALLLLTGCNNDLPTYKLDENINIIEIDGTEYAIHRLSYKDKKYISEPEQYINSEFYERLEIGKQIGRTSDNLQIHIVKNDAKRLIIKGFMYPEDFFILDNSF
jgi:hypothetical protein